MDLTQIESLKKKKSSELKNSRINFDIKNKDVNIYLADLTYTQQQISHESMPSAIGGIATFTKENLHLTKPIRLFKYPEKLAEKLKERIPEIIGFSNYIWNFELSSAFARRIKEVSPKTITVFGGPNYPVDSKQREDFLRKHAEIDIYVVGEGEVAFANLVRALVNSNLEIKAINEELPSVHYIDNNGNAHLTEYLERLHDLTQIPSPYLLGEMDEFFDGQLIPTIQTTRGCPFACTFCVEGVGYYNKVFRNSQEKVNAELDYIGAKMIKIRKLGGRNDLDLVDSNFGMYNQDLETCKAIAKCQEKYGWPEYIQADTGKNNKVKVLDAARLVNGAMRLSGSVQTLTKDVLKNIKRDNISEDELLKLAIEAADISDSRCEIILGLPGENKESHLETIKKIIDSGFNHVLVYQLMMLPGTELYDPEMWKKFDMKMQYRVLPRCYGYYEILGKTMIAVDMEEICTSTNTLSIEDYLECRKIHLIVNIFYNDGFFGTVLKFIKLLGLSVYHWLEIIQETQLKDRIKELFDKFEKSTRDELWDNREKLKEFVQDTNIIDKYIQGELGYNIIYTFKALALSNYVSELKNLVRVSLLQLLSESGLNTRKNIQFAENTLDFDSTRYTNIFQNMEKNPSITLDYDIEKFLEAKELQPINHFKFDNPTTIEFLLNDGQKDIIKRMIGIYGNNDIGVSRILTRVFVKKLLRHPERSKMKIFNPSHISNTGDLYQPR